MTTLHELKWSPAEKKIARSVYDKALQAELAETIEAFKRRAAVVCAPGEMWEIEDFLGSRRREIDEKYDYRYSRLIPVFAWLIREGRVRRSELEGLADEKLAMIDRILAP